MNRSLSQINISNYLTQVLSVCIVYFLIIDVLEYLLTEHWYIFNDISHLFSVLFLIFLIISISFLFKSSKKISITQLIILLCIFLLVVIGHIEYKKYYNYTQEFPKIKKLSKNWSIQGDSILITGKNFGGAWQQGSVRVGDISFNIKEWTNTKIIAEQPVTSNYIKDNLVITNYLKKEAAINFEIKDPSEVL